MCTTKMVPIYFAMWTLVHAATETSNTRRKSSNHTNHDSLAMLQLNVTRGGHFSSLSEASVCMVQDNECMDFDLQLESDSELPKDLGPKAYELVVSRYHEDIRWLDALSDIPTVVYNRGTQSLLPSPRANLRIVNQENIGREDEVMLNHMIAHYDDLAETTVFLQGWPFAHCPSIVSTVRRTLEIVDDPSLDPDLRAGGAEPGLVPISKTTYQYVLSLGLVGFAAEMVKADKVPGTSDEEVRHSARHLYQQLCGTIMDGACPDIQWVSEGAQWAVSRSRIQLQPRSFYQRVKAIGEGHEGKLRGLVLEALWPVLWGASSWGSMDDVFFAEETDLSRIGFAGRKLTIGGSHCEPLHEKKGLLHSCAALMGFCELKWHSKKWDTPSSLLFADQRQRFAIHGSPISDPSVSWGMLVQLIAHKPAQTFAVDADAEGLVSLRKDSQAVKWFLTDAPENLVEHKGARAHRRNQFVLMLNNSNHVGKHFLACHPTTGVPYALREPQAWYVKEYQDGLVGFRSLGKRVLQLVHRRTHHGDELRCVPPSLVRKGEGAFHVKLLLRESDR